MYPVLLLALAWRLGAERRERMMSIRKIATFKSGFEASDHRQVLDGEGIRVLKHLPLINAIVYEVPCHRADSVRSLQEHPMIEDVEDDFIVRIREAAPSARLYWRYPRRVLAQPPQEIDWGVERIQAPQAWSVSQGNSVRVAVIDTGIDLNHPDLKDNVKGAVNVRSPDKGGDDDNGHGTEVAGVIAALNNSIGVVGVAPRASLYAVKALGFRGEGRISNIIEGIQWCMDNGIQVINMSLGSSKDSRSLKRAISAAYKAGIVMVAAAGNSGPGDSVDFPGAYPEVLAVSATDRNDNLASFSSTGPQVALAAPGKDIRTTSLNGSYKIVSGTSFSAPHVTGTVALMLANAPDMVPETVRSLLAATAEKLPGLSPEEEGSGLVDAARAVGAKT